MKDLSAVCAPPTNNQGSLKKPSVRMVLVEGVSVLVRPSLLTQ